MGPLNSPSFLDKKTEAQGAPGWVILNVVSDHIGRLYLTDRSL